MKVVMYVRNLKLMTFEPKNFEKLRTVPPEPKFTGSLLKKACSTHKSCELSWLSILDKTMC